MSRDSAWGTNDFSNCCQNRCLSLSMIWRTLISGCVAGAYVFGKTNEQERGRREAAWRRARRPNSMRGVSWLLR